MNMVKLYPGAMDISAVRCGVFLDVFLTWTLSKQIFVMWSWAFLRHADAV